MYSKPFFSIIIPTYNRAKVLPEAVESVLVQDFKNWELIIVDDGSKDETKTVVNRYLKDRRVRYHWQKNKELNGARNTGVQLAKGRYYLFLDDDDLFLSNHLSSIYSYVSEQQFPKAAIRTGLLMNIKGKTIKGQLYREETQSAILFLWHSPVNLLTFAFHYSIFDQILFEEELLLADDFHFLIRVFLKYPLFQIPKYTVNYQLHPKSRTLTYNRIEHLNNKLKAIDFLWEIHGGELEKYITPRMVEKWKARECLHFSRNAFRFGDKSLGWLFFRKALRGFSFKKMKSYLRTLLLGVLGV